MLDLLASFKTGECGDAKVRLGKLQVRKQSSISLPGIPVFKYVVDSIVMLCISWCFNQTLISTGCVEHLDFVQADDELK
jgi:hypothetical protein